MTLVRFEDLTEEAKTRRMRPILDFLHSTIELARNDDDLAEWLARHLYELQLLLEERSRTPVGQRSPIAP